MKKNFLTLSLVLLAFLGLTSACSSSDEPAPRDEKDIIGVWTDGSGKYLYFLNETVAFDLRLDNSNGEKSYSLMEDSYFYEPGYNFVILMDFRKGLESDNPDSSNWQELVSPEVYQVTLLDKTKLQWCWVDNLSSDKYEGLTTKQIIGKVITEADKGFTLLPSNYQTYTAVSMADFNRLLEEYEVWELLEEEE